MSRPTRRTVLRGLLGGAAVTVGLPVLELFLDSTGRAWADGEGLPRCFGLYFWGNGNRPDRWVPSATGQGEAWALSEELAPLADLKDVLAVISGTNLRVPNLIPHGSGAGGVLSAAAITPVGDEYTFSAPSIDQVVAQALGGQTRFRSLEFGIESGGGHSFNGPFSQNPAEESPHLFFERVFGAGFVAPGEEPIIDPTLALRRSVLDAVLDDATRLRGQVGTADKARLDQHMDGIRDLELRLARLEEDPPDLAACHRPEAPQQDYPDVEGRPQFAERNAANCRIAAMALACDQVRVISNWFHRPVGNALFPGAPDGHHNLTHDEPGDQPEVHAITLQVVEQFGEMVRALRAIPEGDGTLLDRCAVLGTTEISLGRTHSLDNMPILLAGSAGGRLKTDLHARSETGENTTKVHLSVLRALGLNLASFGEGEAEASEGFSAVEV